MLKRLKRSGSASNRALIDRPDIDSWWAARACHSGLLLMGSRLLLMGSGLSEGADTAAPAGCFEGLKCNANIEQKGGDW